MSTPLLLRLTIPRHIARKPTLVGAVLRKANASTTAAVLEDGSSGVSAVAVSSHPSSCGSLDGPGQVANHLTSFLLYTTSQGPTEVRLPSHLPTRFVSSYVFLRSTGSSAFSQTLQFITSVKLQELQRQSETFSQHVDSVIDRARTAGNDIDRVQNLLDGVNTWTGLGGLTATDIPLENIQLYVRPSYNPDRSFEAEMRPPLARGAVFPFPGGFIRLRPILASPLSRFRTGGTS